MVQVTLLSGPYNTIKTLFKGFKEVKQFPSQPINILNYVYYNSKKKEIIITDGHILRIESMDLNIDKCIFFDRKDFTKFSRYPITIYAYEISDLMPYPDYEKCIPEDSFNLTDNNAHCFHLRLEDISNISKTFDKDYNSGLLFVPTRRKNNKDNQRAPIKIYKLELYPDKKYVFCGIIMPCGKSECFYDQF